MPFQGSVVARVFTSDALIPLFDAPVSFTQTDDAGNKTLLAIRYTDASGLTAPLFLDTPDPAASQAPGSPVPPYASVDIQVSYPGYSSATVSGVQVFPTVVTIQALQLRPTPNTSRDEHTQISEQNQDL